MYIIIIGDFMNISNKGFVLVETIVAAVFVLSFFSFLIANLLPMVGEYEKVLDYDSIESKYDAHLIRKMILKDNSCRTKNLITLSEDGYYEFDGTDICLYLENVNYCKKLLSEDYLDVKKIIITRYNTSDIKNKSDKFNRLIKEYIDYLPKYESTIDIGQYFYQRRLIILFNNDRITNIELLINDDGISCGGATC